MGVIICSTHIADPTGLDVFLLRPRRSAAKFPKAGIGRLFQKISDQHKKESRKSALSWFLYYLFHFAHGTVGNAACFLFSTPLFSERWINWHIGTKVLNGFKLSGDAIYRYEDRQHRKCWPYREQNGYILIDNRTAVIKYEKRSYVTAVQFFSILASKAFDTKCNRCLQLFN